MDKKSIISIYLSNKKNLKILWDCLEPNYILNSDTKFNIHNNSDLIITDGVFQNANANFIESLKDKNYPVFLPVLLLTTKHDIGLATSFLWKSIDDLIIMPVNKIELYARIALCLKTRQLSIDNQNITEKKYQEMIESVSDIFFVLDKQLKFSYFNKAAEIFFSIPSESVFGNRIDKIIPNLKGSHIEKKFNEVIDNKASRTFEYTFMKDKENVWLEINIYPNQTGVSVYIKNITLRKRIENELIKANEKAEESNRLKTAFLQNISHEIRTPMNSIIGFSGMLNEPDISEEKRKDYTSIIINKTNQLLSIVTDILLISSIETNQEKVQIDKVCINSIIADLLEEFKTQALNQNISFDSKILLTDEQSKIYTDTTKITQILTKLITNALRFTHKGFIKFGYEIIGSPVQTGHALSQPSTGPASSQPSTGLPPSQPLLQFYVKDTGIGIIAEQQEKIFEHFRQADLSLSKKYGGTGLGLSISKGFVELLGGKIWVQSELGKGSTFYFTIPYNPVHEFEMTNVQPDKY